ncbi:hypothetical protein GCM10008019_42490 [Deinococcus soli (ex Cha et al. 2016)]|nr:hypothetical protein GCM10008019_42490 [Deinococcus soli (ex Cha et al. 2016)]
MAKQGNVGGTAIKTITDFGGVTSTNQASLAVQSTALHSVTVATDGTLSLVPGATDFQAFTPAEVAGLTAQNGWNNTYGPGDKPLTYGFTVSKCTTTCTRTLNAGETGVVNVALRIPKGGATGTAYNFTLNFALVNDSVSRVTRSVTPAETATQASNRLTALGVSTGGEVMTVGAPVSSATTNRTDVSTPGLKVVSAPFVVTLAGSGSAGSADGTGPAASFRFPVGVAVDASGNVIVADTRNNKIRKVTPDGVVTTLAGSSTNTAGSADGTGPAASFQNPNGVAVDATGNMIVTNTPEFCFQIFAAINELPEPRRHTRLWRSRSSRSDLMSSRA